VYRKYPRKILDAELEKKGSTREFEVCRENEEKKEPLGGAKGYEEENLTSVMIWAVLPKVRLVVHSKDQLVMTMKGEGNSSKGVSI